MMRVNYQSNAVEFTKAQLAKSGSPSPLVTISYIGACSLAFDPSGDLWVGGAESLGSTVVEFAKAQLAKSGSPTPRVSISSQSLDEPCRPTFDSSGVGV
jgi:hypothetical protein